MHYSVLILLALVAALPAPVNGGEVAALVLVCLVVPVSIYYVILPQTCLICRMAWKECLDCISGESAARQLRERLAIIADIENGMNHGMAAQRAIDRQRHGMAVAPAEWILADTPYADVRCDDGSLPSVMTRDPVARAIK